MTITAISFDKEYLSFDFWFGDQNRISINSNGYDNEITNKDQKLIEEFIDGQNNSLYLNNYDLSFSLDSDRIQVTGGGYRSGRQSYSIDLDVKCKNIVIVALKQYLSYVEEP